MIVNEHISIGTNSYEKVKTFKNLGALLTNKNSIHEEIKCAYIIQSKHFRLLGYL